MPKPVAMKWIDKDGNTVSAQDENAAFQVRADDPEGGKFTQDVQDGKFAPRRTPVDPDDAAAQEERKARESGKFIGSNAGEVAKADNEAAAKATDAKTADAKADNGKADSSKK